MLRESRVKDLSRFGRNYLEVGRYLEVVYPTLGVKFIAIQENVDRGSIAMPNKQKLEVGEKVRIILEYLEGKIGLLEGERKAGVR